MAKMVQVFMVVRCYACETFQVHQVKKINKWVCKVCNEKQSVVKVYGKGNAADCRKHVQKMNMDRGQKEQEEVTRGQKECDEMARGQKECDEMARGQKEREEMARGQKEREEMVKLAMENHHPPQDYASTFQTSEQAPDEMPSHPVVVASKQSKWTTFIEPQDSEEDSDGDGVYTTEKNVFVQAKKRQKKEMKRRSSDSRALPKSARATLPIHSSSTKETISPYSSTSKEMQLLLDDHSAQVKAAQSCYFLPSESYRKFEDESFVYDQNISQSMHDLSSKPSSHKNTLVRIREDISRYSFDKLSPEVPTTSSRWNKFMTLCESEGEEGDEREGSKVNKTTHAQ